MRIQLAGERECDDLGASEALFELSARDTISGHSFAVLIECRRTNLDRAVATVKRICDTLADAWPAMSEQAIALLRANPDLRDSFLYHSPHCSFDALRPADLVLTELGFTFDQSSQLETIQVDGRLQGVMTRLEVDEGWQVRDLDFGD